MKNKYIKTEIPITIITDDEHKTGDQLELTRQQIERASFYTQSLFNSINYSLETLPDFADNKLQAVIEAARHLCEIGYAVADSILASTSNLTEFIPDEFKEIETEKDLSDLARMISVLLNNPNTPKPIQKGLSTVMADFFNYQVDQDDFADDIDSPEYIARMLESYRGKNQ